MYKIKSSLIVIFTVIFFTATAQVYAGQKNTKGNNSVSSAIEINELSDDEIDSLLFMREEEKMARDVYLTQYETWNDSVFSNIADSEQEHMDAIVPLLDKYNLEDPVIDEVGVFYNPELQELYTELDERGYTAHMEALHVGAYIEEVDMHDIQVAMDKMEHEDIISVYEELLKGSRNHLRSFVSKIEAEGLVYEAQYLPQEEVDAIVDSPMERGSM